MRVLLDGIIFSLQTCGGISGMFARLVDGLMRRNDIEAYLLEREDACNNIFRQSIKVPEDRIIKLPQRRLLIERYMPVTSLPAQFRDGTPFIFHSSYYRVCNARGAVNVTTLHDFTYEIMRLRGALPTLIHSTQKRWAVKHSKGVACVSNATLTDYRKLIGVPSGQIAEVIPNAPLCTPTTEIDISEPRKMNEVLYVGAREYHKNFRLAVDAIAGTSMKLVLCSSTLSADELKLIETTLQPGQWEIHVFPNDNTLSDMYRRCRCLVYPSSYEGFGIPIIEAQMHGTPVIVGNCPASVEVGGEAAIILPDYAPQSLRTAIASLNNQELYRQLQNKGLANAAKYTWASIVDDYVELYHRTVFCVIS